MENWSNKRIEESLIRMAGKVALGLATDGTRNCINIACDEIETRIKDNEWDWKTVRPELAMIAKRTRELITKKARATSA
jgi:hypothetical protein